MHGLMVLCLAGAVAAQTRVVAHVGNTDPTVQGWSAQPGYQSPLQASVGPVVDGGTPVWSVEDQSTGLGSFYLYRRVLTAAETQVAVDDGWRVSARMRIADDTNRPTQLGCVSFELHDGQRGWEAFLGLDMGGNTVVCLATGGDVNNIFAGPRFVVPGNDFHTYELIYDPAIQRAALYVDGAAAIAGYTGWAYSDTPHLIWGAGNSYDSGRGHYQSVELDVGLGLANTIVDGLLVEHRGSTQPGFERWIEQVGYASPLGVTAGPIDDGGTPAWFFDDRSTVLGSWFLSRRFLTPAQAAAATTLGWTLSVRLRIDADFVVPAQLGSPGVEFYDGQRYWDLLFGLDAAGNTLVRLPTGADINNIFSGPLHQVPGHADYHTFDLTYEPAAGRAALYVDGVWIHDIDYTGWLAGGTPQISWGADNSYDAGRGYFNAVSFSIGPRPQDGDNTPPVVTITSPTNGLVTNSQSVTISADVTDVGATAVTSVPVGVAPSTLPAGGGAVSGSLALLEGPNLIAVSATDSANNTSATSIDVYRDTALPVVAISPPEGTIVSTPLPAFGISVTDQTSTTVWIDGNPAGTASVEGGSTYGVSSIMLTGSIGLWQEGSNEIVVVATDAAGNTTTVTRHVILDSTAPIIAIATPPNGACYPAGSPTEIPLSATIDDATATDVTGALAGSLPPGGGTVLGTAVLHEGINVIAVTATNPGLNLSASDMVTVTLDTILPTVTITSPGAAACVRGSIEFHATASDQLPGTVAATAYHVDGVLLPATDLYVVDTTLLADGPHVLRVDATDSCGNVATTSITIHVDNTAPALTVHNPVDLAWVAGMVTFGASASDAGSGLVGLSMKAAEAPPATDGSQTYEFPVPFGSATSLVDTLVASGGLDGDMEFEVTARDCAGNETTIAVTVHVDNTAPQKAIAKPADGSEVRCVIEVMAVVNDPNLASVQFVIDGVATPVQTSPPFRIPFDTRDRLDGDMQITLLATDLAQNVSSSTIQVTVDNLDVEIEPDMLELKSKGGDKSVTVKIEGQSANLLFPIAPQDITLCVPGGSPISATLIHGHHMGWRCNQGHESSHRGHRKDHEQGCHGAEWGVRVKFDRQLLIGALRGAGITNGKVEMTIKVAQGGQTFVIGSDTVKVRSR